MDAAPLPRVSYSGSVAAAEDVVRGGGFDKLPPHDLHRRGVRHLTGGRDDSFSNVRLAPGVRFDRWRSGLRDAMGRVALQIATRLSTDKKVD